MTSTITERDHISLKVAARRLITQCGGVESAVKECRVQKSNLSDYMNPNVRGVYMPIDVVLDLEKFCASASVTEALATLAGGVFIPCHSHHATFGKSLATIGKEVSDVFARASKAIEDSKLSSREVADLDREIHEAIAALVSLQMTINHDSDTKAKG